MSKVVRRIMMMILILFPMIMWIVEGWCWFCCDDDDAICEVETVRESESQKLREHVEAEEKKRRRRETKPFGAVFILFFSPLG